MVSFCLTAWSLECPAQPSSDVSKRARELFEQGKTAMSVGRFDEARLALSESLRLVPKASAAFNLAVAYRGMGQPKEATEVLDRVLSGTYGDAPPEMQEQAERLRSEALADLVPVKLTLAGAKRATVRVDGVEAGHAVQGVPLKLIVNPGERLVSVVAPMRDPWQKTVLARAGKLTSLQVTLALSAEARMSTLELVAKDRKARLEIVGVGSGRGRLVRKLAPGKYQLRLISAEGKRESEVVLNPATRHRVELEPERSGMLSSPWFWVVAGTVTAGAAVGGYFLFSDRREEPVRDPVFGVTETLGRF